MGSGERQEEWPQAGLPDVADHCLVLCSTIIELERAFETGELLARLSCGDLDPILGPLLLHTYRKLASSPPAPAHFMRADAVRALLMEVRNDLIPVQFAHARFLPPPGAAFPSFPSRQELQGGLIEVRFDGLPPTLMRIDQMLAVRFWRIGFTFEQPELAALFARGLLRSVTSRLSRELLRLQHILTQFFPRRRDIPSIVPSTWERSLEHLILDILNEHGWHARMAPLDQDFLEKTDLRVVYPGIRRPRGSRVQVTAVTDAEGHGAKLKAIRNRDEMVFLSPLSLAEFVDTLQRDPAGAPLFDLASFRACLQDKPTDTTDLGYTLKRILLCALKGLPDSPLGPMTRVPPPIRQLIRLFVETRSRESTARLREREQTSGTPHCFASDKVCERNRAGAGFLRTLRPGDRVRGRVSTVVFYGAFIEVGHVSGLLHFKNIPGAVKGMVSQQLTAGQVIEVEVTAVDVGRLRVAFAMPAEPVARSINADLTPSPPKALDR